MKIILSFIVFILCFQQQYYAHLQETHQKITKEAYNLFTLQFGVSPVLKNHIGSQIGYDGGSAWNSGLILSGAWREDKEDVVYGYCNAKPPVTTGLDGAIANLILAGVDIWTGSAECYSSITHFWEPDDGDFTESTMHVRSGFSISYYFSMPNAYQKIRKYADGGWGVNWNAPDGLKLISENGHTMRIERAYLEAPLNFTFSYNSLIDLYKTKRIYFVTSAGSNYRVYDETIGHYVQYTGAVYLSPAYRDCFTFEIIGRMCHLLQDMSVPTHVHIDAIGFDSEGIKTDPYEEKFGSFNLTV